MSPVNYEVVDQSGVLIVDDQPLQAVEQSAAQEKAAAEAIVVTDHASRAVAAERLVRLKRLITFFREKWDPVCQKAFEAHREATKRRGEMIDPLEAACKALGYKVGAFDLAEAQRIRAEELRQIQEAERLAAEARESEIESAEASGATAEEVAALCDMPLVAAPIMPPRRTPIGPVSSRVAYKARVTNKLALVQYVARNAQYLNLLDENQTALNRLAGSLGASMKIPGVEVVQEASTVTRLAQKGVR